LDLKEINVSEIKFNADEKSQIVRKLQMYFREELDQELGQFDAEFLLDFIAEDIGTFFYNRGVYDAQTVLEQKIEEISDAMYQLEKIPNC